jgi:hypothetical protein
MKNSIVTIFVCMLMIVTVFSTVRATLTDNSDGTVTDDDRGDSVGLTWLKIPNTMGMTWNMAMTWADNLVFAGKDDWRLPSVIDFQTGIPDTGWDSLNNEWGHLYGVEWGNPAYQSETAPMTGYLDKWYWTSTEDPANPSQAYAFLASFDGMWINTEKLKTDSYYVTAVRGSPPPAINIKPMALFTQNKNFVDVGTTIEFDPSTSYDPDGTITQYIWDLNGDGISDHFSTTPEVVSCAYSERQPYHVTLTVTDNSGQTTTATHWVWIIPAWVAWALDHGYLLPLSVIIMACLLAYLIVKEYVIWRRKKP